jgi:hypothetical protein
MFLLLSTVLYLVYIDPTYIETQKALARERELVGYIADAKTAQAKIDDLKAQYAEFPAGADQALQVLMPASIDQTRLIVDMDAVIQKLGLVMKSPGVLVEKGEPLDKYQVQFSVSAPYAVFRTFLHDLESSLALRDMGSLAFSARGVGKDEFSSISPALAIHEYSLTITTYSLHQ